MLTPAELAAAFKVSERTVSRMVIDGCPSMLVGSRRRFDLAVVTAWCTARAEAGPQVKALPVTRSRQASAAVSAFTDASRSVRLRVMPSR
jgi:phage terminase Nu1 subunit (DNA packaging protein)